MSKSKAQIRATAKFNKKAYDTILLSLRKDATLTADFVKAHAAEMGESTNGFIKRAITEAIERDLQGGE